MKLHQILIEVLYHFGGASMLIISLHMLYRMFTTGVQPSLIGLVVLAMGGAYLGTVVKDLYRVLYLKESYKLGV